MDPRARRGDVALIGRAVELAAVRDAIGRAHAGRGAALVLVTGASRTGKTRLLEEVAAEARARGGALVLAGRAEPLRRAQGFGLLAELLRSAIGVPVGSDPGLARAALLAWCARRAPGLTEDDAVCLGYLLGVVDRAEPAIELTDGDPRRIRDATWAAATHLVAAVVAEEPVLIVVDDLDCADDASADLLAHLGRRLHDRRLAILGSALHEGPADAESRSRLTEGSASAESRPTLTEGSADAEWARVALGPLGAEAARALAEAERVMEERLADLPEGARAVLAAGAVLGGRVWEGALEAMGVSGAGALLEELAARGVASPSPASRLAGEREWQIRFRASPDQAGFALEPGVAAAAHLAAGRWLRARGEEPAMVGEHLVRGGAGEEAAAALEAAAEAAERAGALSSAQALAFRAAALGEGGRARVRRRLLGVRQGATSAVGREELLAQAAALLAEAEALLTAASDGAMARAALVSAGGALFVLGETGDVLLTRLADTARSAAVLGEVETAAWGVRHASFALSVTGRQAEAEALLGEIGRPLIQLDPDAAAALSHARGILLLNGGRAVEATEELGLAFDLACAANHRGAAVELGSDYAYGLLVAGDLDACFDVLEHAFELAEEAGSGYDQILQNVIEHEMWAGPHRRMNAPLVRRAFERARAVCEDDERRYSLCLRGNLLAFSGAWPDDARALSPEAILAQHGAALALTQEAGFWELSGELECAAAGALLRLGRAGEALERAEAALALGERIDLPIYRIQALLVTHDAARALGRAAVTREAVERAAALLQQELDRRAGTRFARLLVEGVAINRRLLAACADLGVPGPAFGGVGRAGCA